MVQTCTRMQAEFEDICEESQLWVKLHTLEQLCQEQGLFGEHQDVSGCVSPPLSSVTCSRQGNHNKFVTDHI